MFTAIGEINVICSDRERSLTFYTQVLGLRILSTEGSAVHLQGVGQRLTISNSTG